MFLKNEKNKFIFGTGKGLIKLPPSCGAWLIYVNQLTAEKINISLWEEIGNGNRQSLETLYKRLYVDLYNYGIHVSADPELVKDAINDLFLDLWSNRLKPVAITNVKSYCFTCLRHKLYALFRHKKRSETGIRSFAAGCSSNESSFEEKITERETRNELEVKMFLIISNLSPRQRELVRLRYFSNLSVDEIAAKTGITPKTVYNTICNALRIIENQMTLQLFILVQLVLFLF